MTLIILEINCLFMVTPPFIEDRAMNIAMVIRWQQKLGDSLERTNSALNRSCELQRQMFSVTWLNPACWLLEM